MRERDDSRSDPLIAAMAPASPGRPGPGPL